MKNCYPSIARQLQMLPTHRLIVILAFPCLVEKESTCSHPASQLWHWCADVDHFTWGKKWNSKRNTCGQSARKNNLQPPSICFDVPSMLITSPGRNKKESICSHPALALMCHQSWSHNPGQNEVKRKDCFTWGKNDIIKILALMPWCAINVDHFTWGRNEINQNTCGTAPETKRRNQPAVTQCCWCWCLDMLSPCQKRNQPEAIQHHGIDASTCCWCTGWSLCTWHHWGKNKIK